MEKTTKSSEETQKLAEDLSKDLKIPKVFALYGDLGSGKTTFVQGMAKSLGINQRILSPTFVLHRIYPFGGKELHHLDLYRLNSVLDANSLGLNDLFQEKNVVVVIEWPEKIESILPPNTVKIYFEHLKGDERKIKILE